MSTPPDDHGRGPEVKPRSGHSGRPPIDKILKEARRGDLESVKRHLNQRATHPMADQGRRTSEALYPAVM